MKILVISGFLGAGKTTFIKTMSEKTKRDFCVFENEYAQEDIDKAVLTENSNMNIWELTENCICCSGKQDFATSILTISNTVDPEYLIVEPTGVAKLSSILNNIQKIEYERISLLKPVTIVDGSRIQEQQKEFQVIYTDQIKNSELVIVSKCEHAERDELQMIKKQIRMINPLAEVLIDHYKQQSLTWWNRILAQNIDGTVYTLEPVNNGADLENMNLTDIQIPTLTHLINFLEMVTFGVFGNIYRAKGFLPCGKEWIHFEIVDREYSITGIKTQEQAKCVFIGKRICRAGIRDILAPMSSNEHFQHYKKVSFVR